MFVHKLIKVVRFPTAAGLLPDSTSAIAAMKMEMFMVFPSCRRGSARGSASAPLHTMARDCRASAGRGQTSQCAGFARSMFSCERDAKFDCSDE